VLARRLMLQLNRAECAHNGTVLHVIGEKTLRWIFNKHRVTLVLLIA
jgi:hypothetical protein